MSQTKSRSKLKIISNSVPSNSITNPKLELGDIGFKQLSIDGHQRKSLGLYFMPPNQQEILMTESNLQLQKWIELVFHAILKSDYSNSFELAKNMYDSWDIFIDGCKHEIRVFSHEYTASLNYASKSKSKRGWLAKSREVDGYFFIDPYHIDSQWNVYWVSSDNIREMFLKKTNNKTVAVKKLDILNTLNGI